MKEESAAASCLEQHQHIALNAGVARLLQLMSLGTRTAYRSWVIDELERTLEQIDRVCGVPKQPIPRRVRALLLAPIRPIRFSPNLHEYVEGVAWALPVWGLEVRVVATESAELVRRFRRWVVGCDRAHLEDVAAVLEVMTT